MEEKPQFLFTIFGIGITKKILIGAIIAILLILTVILVPKNLKSNKITFNIQEEVLKFNEYQNKLINTKT